MVGFGESDKPDAPYDRPPLARWLKDFVDAIGLRKASIVSESFDGAMSLQFAHDYPEWVNKLVLMDADAVGGWEGGMDLIDTVSMMLDHIIPSRGRVKKNPQELAVTEAEEVDDPLVDYFYGVLRSDDAHNWFWQGRGSAIKAMPKDELATIETPTLLLWGEDDELFFPLAMLKPLRLACPTPNCMSFLSASIRPVWTGPKRWCKRSSDA